MTPTPKQLKILKWLGENPQCASSWTAWEIAQYLKIDVGTVAFGLDELVQADFVIRVKGEEGPEYNPTQDGIKYLEGLEDGMHDMVR